MKVKSQSLSELFYTTDTYGTFSTDLLDEHWFEESDFDHEGFMKDLAELHAEVINSVLPAGGIESVKVLKTSSPREYNFQTDQVELEIELDEDKLDRYLHMHNNAQEFDKFLREHFTSRDGFWSFTPNNIMDFNETVEGVSDEYRGEENRDKCLTILAGWYLTGECLTEDEYMDQMYDKLHEIMWNNFNQFTDETWEKYKAYEEEFELEKKQLPIPGVDKRPVYCMDIEEWYKERNGL